MSNFQQHMGVGQMMPQQQQQRQLHPPMPRGMAGQQNINMQNLIYQSLNQHTGPLNDWQANVLIQERMSLVLNIIGNLRLASQHQPNPPSIQKMIEIGVKFEKDIFEKSPDKAQYKLEVQLKLDQLLLRRNESQQSLQQSLNMQAQLQAQQAQQSAQNQQMMNGMNQGPRNMPQQPGQQPFHQIQHQMQATPLPGQQPQPPQMPMGMPNDAMAPNQQQAFQMAMVQQQHQQSQNGPARPPGQGPGQQLSQHDSSLILKMTQELMNNASEQERSQLRATVHARLDPAILQKYQSQGVDPLMMYYRNQAMVRLRNGRQQQMAQAQAQAQALAQQRGVQNGAMASQPMQQQRSINPSPLNGQAQPPTSMGGAPDLNFMGNMGNLIDQQQQGVMAQEAGQMVVPVSGAPRNATPQPGQLGNPIGQRMGPNGNAGARQQIFDPQFARAQQQQAQEAARATAQAQAQHLALQGQPGGMGNGPMPPQQSPAMGTLNTPLRTPAQQNPPDSVQMIANGQFGQPVDARSMQGNQRQPVNQLNNPNVAAILNSMPQELQSRFRSLPQDRIAEAVMKWNQQRGRNLQGGQPPMSMPNGQLQTGPQSGRFQPPNGMGQVTPGNPGHRPPQPGMHNMSMDQQRILHENMARMQQNQQGQNNLPPQRMNPVNAATNEQRLLAHMDTLDFPPMLYTHQDMPRGIPQDVKKWGPLKQWAQGNPNVSPEQVELMKNFQKMHFHQLRRNGQIGPPMGMQPGGQGGPVNMATIPPGSSAPVANMSQNPMPSGNFMAPGQMRVPTPQDIQNARSHPNFVSASDEQIRNVLIRKFNQSNPQQQQQQQQQQLSQQQRQTQQFMQQQMANQAAQAQHPRPGQPHAQNPMSVQQPKQPQTNAEPPMPNNAAHARARPPTGRRPGPQTSSPAQPPKNNLKRASSDDVVEVPNPNTPQQNRPAPQTNQEQSQAPQPRALTAQQIAALDPESRKRDEQQMQRWKQSRGQIPNDEDTQRLKAIMDEEAARPREAVADIKMGPHEKAQLIQLLRTVQPSLVGMSKTLPKWFQITKDENRVRIFLRLRARLSRQFKDQSLPQPRDGFSMQPAEVVEARNFVYSMVNDLRVTAMKKDPSAQGNAGAVPHPNAQAAQAAATSTVPLNAANLQQQQQQLNKIHQRSNSRSSHTPAAPTSTQPPFSFGAQSPHGHGAPVAYGKSTMTQENLQIPARKKQKSNNTGQITPGANASPQINKATSPDLRRQAAPEPKQQPKPILCCSEPDCERHTVGFDTEEALRAHTQEEHIRPLENPLKYARESLANTLGLDAQGKPKQAAQDGTAAGVKMVAGGSKQGQTPNVKAGNTPGAGTPMNRQVSVASGKPNVTSNAKGPGESGKAAQVKSQPGRRDSKPAQVDAAALDPWVNSTIDPNDLFQNFQTFESGGGGAISDMNVYRSLTPNDTPESSKDGISEPNSDISDGVGLDISLDIFDDSWQPFGSTEPDLMDFNFNSSEDDLLTFDDEKPVPNYQTWDDLVDPAASDKPFVFDSSGYSMSAE